MAAMAGRSRFERHPRITIAALLLLSSLAFLAAAELILRSAGLGSPPLYVRDVACGFRLRPNQTLERFHGARLHVNNLGLRAERDWDDSPDGKILFLGDSVTYGGNHVSNEALFSEVVGRKLPGYEVGNAGVPSWGVENVHGLVVGAGFLPAEIYVTTLIEQDFFRGMSSGLHRPHVWYAPPGLALVELSHFLWSVTSSRLRGERRQFRDGGLRDHEPAPFRARLARVAARKLREMDRLIRSRGFQHLVYISPTRGQVLGEQPVNPFVRDLLEEHEIVATYLLERPELTRRSPEQRASWFQDPHHLTDAGHEVWGAAIAADLVRLVGSSGSAP
jgi:hypothetical protein